MLVLLLGLLQFLWFVSKNDHIIWKLNQKVFEKSNVQILGVQYSDGYSSYKWPNQHNKCVKIFKHKLSVDPFSSTLVLRLNQHFWNSLGSCTFSINFFYLHGWPMLLWLSNQFVCSVRLDCGGNIPLPKAFFIYQTIPQKCY